MLNNIEFYLRSENQETGTPIDKSIDYVDWAFTQESDFTSAVIPHFLESIVAPVEGYTVPIIENSYIEFYRAKSVLSEEYIGVSTDLIIPKSAIITYLNQNNSADLSNLQNEYFSDQNDHFVIDQVHAEKFIDILENPTPERSEIRKKIIEESMSIYDDFVNRTD